MEHTVGPTEGLVLAILVLYLGNFLTSRIELLRTYNIPTAVTGGLLCSTVIGVIFWSGQRMRRGDRSGVMPSWLSSQCGSKSRCKATRRRSGRQ